MRPESFGRSGEAHGAIDEQRCILWPEGYPGESFVFNRRPHGETAWGGSREGHRENFLSDAGACIAGAFVAFGK